MFTIEVDEDGYQLTGPGGEESGVTDYGESAQVEVDGKTYEVTVGSAAEAMTEPQQIYILLDESPNVEEVEFELEDDEDEDDEVPA
jgi:hypothetical protein